MKINYKILSVLLVVGLAITALLAFPTATGTLTSRSMTFSKVKGVTLVPAKMMVLTGDSVYVNGIEINGTWSVGKPWPYQAIAWLKDKTSDNPLAGLDWSGINIDTTWAIADLGNGVGKYTINKKYTQEYVNGGWTNAALTGFLAKNSAYFVDVYSLQGTKLSLLKSLKFDKANNDTTFARALYEVSYVAEGRGSYPINEAKRPDSLISATVQSRIYLRNGLNSAWFNIPGGTESLVYVFKTKDSTFASINQPLQVLTSDEVGCVTEVKVLTPLPTAGFYSAGDSIDIQINLKNNAGTDLDYVNNALALGVSRIEVLCSGPKDDYYQVFTNRYIMNNSAFTYDSVKKQKYNSNIVRIPLPATLPNGNGTYTIFVGARRTLGANYEMVKLTDIQVGTTTVSKMNFSSNDATKSCGSCHGVNGPTGHHSAKGVEQCMPCHTKTFRSGAGFDELVHAEHQNNPNIALPIGKCNTCHLNDSENKFGKEAGTACTACHTVIPFMPVDHAANAPLYNASGMGCNNLNCHSGGGMGVFKNAKETHAALETKYVGGKLTAKKISYDLALDSYDDPAWKKAESITNKDGIKIQSFYSDNNIFVKLEWEDGHQNYAGKAAGSISTARNKWSFDGAKWTKSGSEDRISINWTMDSPAGASCALTCHGEGKGHFTYSGKMDNWTWKSQRSWPIDYVDDGYWDNAGRKSDVTLTGYMGKDNQNTPGTLPIKMAKDPANNIKDYLMESETVDFDSTKFKAGDKIFGHYLNDAAQPIITGSRADIRAKAKFDETTKKWTVIMKRALNTGNNDDAIFDIEKTIDFTIARFDNEGSKHAAQGFDMGIYTLSFSKEVVSVEKQIDKVADVNIYPNPVRDNSVISFNVVKAEHINVVITDVHGRIVSVLNNQLLNIGNYQLPLNLTNASSGVYYCRFYYSDKEIVKPFLLVK